MKASDDDFWKAVRLGREPHLTKNEKLDLAYLMADFNITQFREYLVQTGYEQSQTTPRASQ